MLTELYHDLLGRNPDSIALLYDIPAIQAGTTTEQLALSIVTSDEFILGHTSSKSTPLASQTELLDALYGDVLGRVPDALGVNYWVARFNAGVDPRAIAGSFVNSLEASASATSVLQKAPNPARATPAYYFGAANTDGSLPGPFVGTSKQAKVADLIFADLSAYLDQGEGATFNVLKSHSSYSTDVYLTFNGRVS